MRRSAANCNPQALDKKVNEFDVENDREQRNGKQKGRWKMLGISLLVFALAFGAGAASKLLIQPAWAKDYSVKWSDDLGTLCRDLSYGPEEANTFDLYLPKEGGKDHYGLVVYLHAGGFTSGDKSDDQAMLAWLCSKGYVAAGINYTLRTETNEASVLSQSRDIQKAIPEVIEAAANAGYPIDKMAIGGGSAGHTLDMIYAYQDGAKAPVPVVLTFGGVGPASFYQEEWGVFGLDQSNEACAELFGVMAGTEITPQEVADGSYLEKVRPIAAADWVKHNPVPTVADYGKQDKVQPFLASLHLKKALEDNHVDHQFFVFEHSGHALQNDDAMAKKWMEAIDQYLDRYMPV